MTEQPGDWDYMQALDEVKAEDQAQRTQPNGHDTRQFALVRFRDIKLGKEPNYLVKGLIPREGLIVIWGPPKCGKTFWVFDLMMHVALNWPYRGRRVETGTIVYIACEGERGLAARKEAFRLAKLAESDNPPFYLLTTRLDLAAQVDALILDIAAQIPDAPCSAIVIDTLNRSIRGSESKDEDMSAYLAAADALRDSFKCAVVIIHHCGIDASRPRGHTSLTGAVDAQIAVKRNTAGQIIAAIEWMKDGPEGDEIVSRLEVIKAGEDENDEPMTSCIVEAVDGPTAKHPKQGKLVGAALVGFEQLRNCMADHAEKLPTSPHIPAAVTGVTLTLWRGYLEKAGVINTEGNPREQFRRIRVTLQGRGFIGVWNDFVWLSHGVT